VIERLDGRSFDAAVPELAELMVDAVQSGASIGWLDDVTADDAAAWWVSSVRPGVEPGVVRCYAARDAEGVCGCVLVRRVTWPNGTHRAELAKLLVHRRARGRGLGQALLTTAVDGARGDGISLLVLDTCSDTTSERLYRREGWHEVGRVPGYALDPDGTPHDTIYFWLPVTAAH
jgi:ribosomal protein S18 acetylase RimI-like enzyme